MKRLLTILLALVMVLALGTSAFADGPGSITIENATVGKEYAGYKIFDATWDEDKANVAYSIKSGNPWYDLVNGDGSPFQLERVGSSDVYNVFVKDSETDDSIRDWIRAQTLPDAPDLAAETATGNTVMWVDVPYGYYLVTSNLGALVTVSNVKGEIIIIDKNQQPGWEKPDPPGNTQAGKNVSADGTVYGLTSTAGIGDTVHYKINAYVPKYNQDKQVYKYIFTDTLDDGLSYDTGSLTLTLNGNPLAVTNDYEILVTSQKINVTIFAYGMEALYPTDAHLEIKYTATVTEEAVHINENEALMDWTQFDPTSSPTEPGGDNPPTSADIYDPDTPGTTPPSSTTTTYVYGFNLKKYAVSGVAGNELTGAEFKLYDAEGEILIVLDEERDIYRPAFTGEASVTIKAGTAAIFGLDLGTYWLEEVVTPSGYNPLAEKQKVVIALKGEGDGGDDLVNSETGYLNAEVQVINMTGTLLPETGGIGTKIFYIVGGILALGALVILVSRRRMPNGR